MEFKAQLTDFKGQLTDLKVQLTHIALVSWCDAP